MRHCGLRARTWDNLWVAALLAMLLKVLALPMASTLGDLSLAQLLAGSYCSSGGVQPAMLDKDGKLGEDVRPRALLLRPRRPCTTACLFDSGRLCPACAACRPATRCSGAFAPALLAVDQPPCLPESDRLTCKDPGRTR